MKTERRLRLLEAKIEDLNKQVQFLLKVTGLDLSKLRTAPDKDLLDYYRGAVELLGADQDALAPEICERWAPIFAQFSGYEMTRLQGIVDYDHTWEPFYHLCVKMMTAVRQHSTFTSDPGMQHLYSFLDRSLRNLRNVAVVMIKKYPKNLPTKAKVLLKGDDPLSYL